MKQRKGLTTVCYCTKGAFMVSEADKVGNEHRYKVGVPTLFM